MAHNLAPGDVFEHDGVRYTALSRPDMGGGQLTIHVQGPDGGRDLLALSPYRRYELG